MKIKIFFDVVTDYYEIYVVNELQSKALTDDHYWVDYTPGTVPPIFLKLSAPLYHAIMKEALNLGVPNRPNELKERLS